jgi:hypothetical protein
MTDWRKVIGFEKHTYVESFPVSSFLLSGVSFYKDTIKNIEIGDTLYMTSDSNKYDSSAIVIKKNQDICGYVPRDLKEKIQPFVPSTVRVFDKRYIENGIYSLRVDIISPSLIQIRTGAAEEHRATYAGLTEGRRALPPLNST